jgi:membrane-bound ClpP family serine protease
MVGLLLRKVKRFESYGTLNLENAIGKIGTVYLSIPANSNGEGQIQIEVQGRLTTLDAKSVGEEIKTGRKVLVYDVKDGKLLVSPYKDIDLEINSN